MAQTVSIFCLDGASDICPQEDRELTILAHDALASLNATGVAVAIEDGERIVCRARAGTSAPEIGTVLDHNSGISARCIREDASLAVYDTELDARVNSDACRTLGIRSLAVAPVHRASRVIGIIEVFSNFPSCFHQESLRRLQAYAARASAIWAPEAQIELVERETAETGERSQARIEPKASRGISATESPVTSNSGSGNRGVEPASAQAPDPLEFIGTLGSEKKGAAWKWSLVAATVIPVILVGFSSHNPLRDLARAAGNVLPSSSAAPQSQATERRTPPEKSATPTSAQATETSASVDPNLAPLSKVDDSPSPSTEARERANSGDVQAQLTLADHYAAEGPEKNVIKAAEWYIVAGIGGNAQARQTATELTGKLSANQIAQIRFQVAQMFRNGVGVPPDLETAYSWFVLAQAAGDARADAEEKNLGTVMRPDEIIEAQNRAATWLAAHKRKSSPNLRSFNVDRSAEVR